MGFLNGATITVDAILTKHGRRKLSQGQSLGISQFALSDDGIDYSLFNPDNPNGSAHYGEAITDLPQMEAVPDDLNLMKYKLMTMDRNTIFLPKISGIQKDYTITNQTEKIKISPTTENATDNGYDFYFNSTSEVNILGGTRKKDIGGNTRTFLSRAEISQGTQVSGRELTLTAKPTDVTRNITIQVVGQQTGAVTYVDVQINSNIRKPASV